MNDLVMCRLRLLSFLYLLFSISAPGLFGQIQNTYTSGTIERVELSADTVLYASRSSDDTIEVEVDVSFSRQSGLVLGTNVFTMRLQLLDDEGAVLQSQDESIGERTTATVTPVTFSYSIEPEAQLDVNKRYYIRAQLYRMGTGAFPRLQAVNSPMNSSSSQFFHFVNTQSSDAALNVLFDYDEVEWQRLFAIRTSETQQTFQVDVIGNIYRYDGYSASNGSDDVEFVLSYELVNGVTDEVVATASNESRQTVSLARYYIHYGSGLLYPSTVQNHAFTIDIEPLEQLDSVNDHFYVRVTAAHIEEAGEDPVIAGQKQSMSHRLLHFSGDLEFNGLATTFTEVSNTPTASVGGINYVNTWLQVTNNSGSVSSWDIYQFGNDEQLSEVRLMSNGRASVQVGEVALGTVADVEFDDVIKAAGDIKFGYQSLKLTPSGPVSGEQLDGSPTTAITLFLPTGLGYTKDDILLNQKRLLDLIPMPGPVALDNLFNPMESFQATPSGRTWLHQEGRPYGIEFDQISFDPALGEISVNPVDVVYNQADALGALEAHSGDLEAVSMAVKPSNEQYYRYATSVVGQVQIRADFNGLALVSSQLSLSAGEFSPHFPLSGLLRWTGTGDIFQVDSLIDPSQSFLRGVQAVRMDYHQSCPDAFCGLGQPPSELLTWIADGSQLSFTPDGGLSGSGDLLKEGLDWGYLETKGNGEELYAHRTGAFDRGQFLIAGHALMGLSDVWNSSPATSKYDFDHSPSVLLLAGYDRNLMQHERFGTNEYLLGVGDYPGLNFRVSDFSDLEGYSRIGRPDASIPDFAFTPDVNAKYYVRPAGVSGVHEAQDDSFDSSLTIYGYPFKLDNYGLSFLDSENHESQTNGSLSVPEPANFSQSFLELSLSCVGELEEAELDPRDLGEKTLEYWNGAFEPKTMRFLAPVGDDVCLRTGDPILAMGLTTEVAHVDAVLFGEMGFFPDGEIAAAADGYPVDSRFLLPAQLELDGPSGEASYTMTPVSALYFNDHAEGPAERGFATFAATQDVPFFVDVLVQVMTSADADSSVQYDVVGGWPTQGWTEAGASYFTHAEFDGGNIGWPTASAADLSSYDDYRRPSSAVPSAYTPLALQSFFGVLDFEYPLKWNTSSRYYRSYSAQNDNLMVLNIEHSVDYLSAEHIEVSFGVQYDGLPQLNLSNMLFSGPRINSVRAKPSSKVRRRRS
ncbi:hypothetical protein SH580_20405 [Coraliomargarita algicola]|uniref:Calx-beta domain-containing protein n=1 Tax=Coraliomargarita algicola TaxID=3092156 RepID=A0ABZ0RKJ9_9BACT|nr:hypothetical protein [Coraliomargarita sp. J2-16]WPJ95784.1 hypothetical protein SH580_20405 [Coraliomargarita sp. J2-16]